MTLEALLEETALAVLILVVYCIPVAESESCLKIPVLAKDPLISVSDTCAGSPALVTD